MSMNNLRIGDHIILKGKYPCRVIEINKSAPGKHGHAQYSVFGRDVLTDKKHNDIFKHRDHYIEVQVSRESYM